MHHSHYQYMVSFPSFSCARSPILLCRCSCHGHRPSETVYSAQPTGFEDSAHPDYVCRLKRSLYGLKQAPRAWRSRFASLLKIGFVEAKTDTSLFVYHSGADLVYLLLYVDDIILTASSTSLLHRTTTTTTTTT